MSENTPNQPANNAEGEDPCSYQRFLFPAALVLSGLRRDDAPDSVRRAYEVLDKDESSVDECKGAIVSILEGLRFSPRFIEKEVKYKALNKKFLKAIRACKATDMFNGPYTGSSCELRMDRLLVCAKLLDSIEGK